MGQTNATYAARILARLIAKQEGLGMNDRAFAAHIGLHRTTWVMTKLGHWAPGLPVALAALRTFEDLDPIVGPFLLTCGVRSSNDDVRIRAVRLRDVDVLTEMEVGVDG